MIDSTEILTIIASLLLSIAGLLCGIILFKKPVSHHTPTDASLKELKTEIMAVLMTQENALRDVNTKIATIILSLHTTQTEALQKLSHENTEKFTSLRTHLAENNQSFIQKISDLVNVIVQEQQKARTNHARAIGELSDRLNQYMQSQTTTLRSTVDSRLQKLSEQFNQLQNNIKQDQEKGRTSHSEAIKEISDRFNQQMNSVRAAVTEKLHEAVEKQMESSFQRVVEQFKQMQQAMGEIRHMTSQVGDLKRLFSNVKARGGWGEAQLKTILDDVLPPGAWEQNVRIGQSNNIVEFAVRIPVRRDQSPLLCIDSKFPTESYERLLAADEHNQQNEVEAARRELKKTVKLEAQKISDKYIHRPQTVDYGIMYVPTDSLYMEITRIPGLLDEVGRQYRIYIMGPVLMAALLRTIHLGYVNVALDEHTETIARLLAQTQQEMLKMDDILEKLARQTSTVSNSIEKARQRTRVLKKKLDKGASSIQKMARASPQQLHNDDAIEPHSASQDD